MRGPTDSLFVGIIFVCSPRWLELTVDQLVLGSFSLWETELDSSWNRGLPPLAAGADPRGRIGWYRVLNGK